MRAFLSESECRIVEESVIARDEGRYHNLRPLFVDGDPEEEVFSFSRAGKLVRRVVPREWIGHVLCYVVEKADGEPAREDAR
jgi:hypothetical protein